jgi:hypothetical protein
VSQIDNDVTPTGAQAALADVSCPSVSLCVAVDSAGNVLTSIAPAGGPGTWTASDVNGTNGLSGVSCPLTSLCVAAGGSTILVSTAPAAGVQGWAPSTIPYALSRISCGAVSLCVAAGQSGDIVSSTNPVGGSSAWTASYIEPYTVDAATCSPSSRCFALDGIGGLSVGRRSPLVSVLASPLQAAASPPPAARRIRTLLIHRGYSLTFTAPIAGRLAITWRARGREAVIGAAAANFKTAGTRAVKLVLTPAGRRLLQNARRVTVTATASFTPSGARAVTVKRSFALAR